MKNPLHKLLIVLASALVTIPIASLAQDYYQATGNPAQRSAVSSAIFRTEFTSIETDISDKLPAYTGNANEFVVVNAGATALTSKTAAEANLADTSAAATITGLWTFENQLDIDNGNSLRLYDSTDTDFADYSHDGTDYNLAFTTTTDWNITGINALGIASTGDVKLLLEADTDNVTETDNAWIEFNQDGGATKAEIGYGGGSDISPSGGTMTGSLNHDLIFWQNGGSGFAWGGASADMQLHHSGLLARLDLRNGYYLRIYDSTQVDSVDLKHDGTDFIIGGTTTDSILLQPLSGTTGLEVDKSSTAADSRILVWDVDDAALKRVEFGADDSCGTGFKCMRVLN